jgi:hypothetical protein
MSNFIEYSSWIVAFITLCSVLKFYVYYKQFNVYILRYIEIGEIIILFLDNLLAYLCIIIPATLSTFIFFKKNLIPITEENYYGVINGYFRNYQIPIAIWILVLLGILVAKILSKTITCKEWLLQVLLSIFVILLMPLGLILLKLYLIKTFNTQIGFRYILCTGILLILAIFSLFIAYNEAKKVKNQRNVEVFIEDAIFKNPNYCLLGVTKNYFFIFNKQNATTTTFPIGKLKKINTRSPHI